MSKTVLITGASGLIGTQLTQLLLRRGVDVRHLSHSGRHSTVDTMTWDPENGILGERALNEVGTIIHLAGASVAEKRWTNRRKKEIVDSRTKSTKLLFQLLKNQPHTVTTFISASAIGYYGFDNKQWLDETAPAGNDFLASVTKEWEMSVDEISSLGIRVVKMRIGVVLAEKGGALAPIKKSIKLNVGAALGSGEQIISWVHLADVCHAFILAAKNQSMEGAYNVAAPEPVSNRQLTEQVALHLKKQLLLPSVPSFVLRLMFGEMADIILNGSKISSQKLVDSGFQFQYPTLSIALQDLLKKR